MHLTGWLKLLHDVREIRQKVSALEDGLLHEVRRLAEAEESDRKRREFMEGYMKNPPRWRESSAGPESPTTPTKEST
jgi:hypothetical protein